MIFKRKPVCFISCSLSDKQNSRKIQEFLSNEGVEARTLWDIKPVNRMILEVLQSEILEADFVIVLVPSDESSQVRQDFYFELGVVIGMNKPTIILVGTSTKSTSNVELPSFLAGTLYLRYERENIETCFTYLHNWRKLLPQL